MEKGFCARDITCRLLLVEGRMGPICVGRGGMYQASDMIYASPHTRDKAQRLFLHQDGTASSSSRHEVLQELFARRIQGTLRLCRCKHGS